MNQGPAGLRSQRHRMRRGMEIKASYLEGIARDLATLMRKFDVRKNPLGGGGAVRRCTPWKPSFDSSGETPAVTFSLGLLNQTAATNWDTPLTIAADAVKWPTLNVTASNGRITGFTISLEDGPPDEDTIQQDTPPDAFKIVLGVIDSLHACMAVDENLEASAIEVFRTSRNPPTEGAEPFYRWWRWKVNANTSGEYPYVT